MTPYGPRTNPHNDLIRVGDAERDAVTTMLHEAFSEGRLNSHELDQRLDAALNARTRRDLDVLIFDLPQAQSVPQRRPASRPHPAGLPHALAVAGIATALGLALLLTTGHFPLLPPIIVAVLLANRHLWRGHRGRRC
ncbi:DUF1707 domain-containing protein [Sphaerimonospora cavernae]|uniref:DUF1707 domain-containing protein n=1 Tax=Sphaerimonospora cavernae TaxID=1740611 RepID=A0ABV6UB17_9ACTN